jgi:multidrug efflux pump subunit AcrA (membrane-fusion protein)
VVSQLHSMHSMARDKHVVRWLIVGGCLLAVIGFIGYRRWRPVGVETMAVVRGRAVEAVYATGTVEPRHKAVVKARMSEHVAALLVDAGDKVAAGQLLARIDNPLHTFALAQGKIELAKAKTQAGKASPQLAGLQAQAKVWRAQLDLAQIELARSEKLASAGVLTMQELDVARAKATQLAAQVSAADNQLRSMQLELGSSRDQLATRVQSLASEVDDGMVYSPISGVVLHRDVELGEVVAQNQSLFEIAVDSDLLIELRVDEADIARVKDGQPELGPNQQLESSTVALSFYAFPTQAFAGHVESILPEPDRVRRSYTVRVKLDKPLPGLRIGMSAEANIIVERKDDALLVPAEAIDNGEAWFAVAGRAVRRPVTIGIRDLATVEIVAGAVVGDQAIVNAKAAKLTQGQRVSTAAVGDGTTIRSARTNARSGTDAPATPTTAATTPATTTASP